MSTPAPPRSTGALHAAQQQLDELDALIQRMLTLPINPAEEPAPPEPAAAAMPPEAPAETFVEAEVPLEAPRRLEEPPPPEPKVARKPKARPRSAPPPEPQLEVEFLPPPLLDPLEVEFRPMPLASDLAIDGDDEALPPAEPFRSDLADAQSDMADDEYIEEEAAPHPEEFAAPAERRRPLVRVNQAFDRLTYPLGATGYWLRSAAGRDVLGWSGVLLITGSVAWAVLDWLGWTW
jgi:hypothetical protein